jgi:hypothetical protein
MIETNRYSIARILVAVALLGLLLLSGCISADQPEKTGDGVARFYVDNDSVVCYWHQESDAGGLSCLPVNETDYYPSEAPDG